MEGKDSAPLPMHKTTESSDNDSFVDTDLDPAPDQNLSSELNSIEKPIGKFLVQSGTLVQWIQRRMIFWLLIN
jgi:hypothetical protein